MVEDPKMQFIEEVGLFFERGGLFFEQGGLSRMAGRIIGWLLICNPPHQSAQDLEEVLHASKGSISTNIRLLLGTGLVKPTSLPGDRKTYYYIPEGVWSDFLRKSLEEVRQFKNLAERGLKVVEEKPDNLRRRLEELHSVYTFMEAEIPHLFERWEQTYEA